MSIYSECSEALTSLMEHPPDDLQGVFTEIDVVRKAGKPGWSSSNFKEAGRHANQVVGTQYRARKLCRYGPVTLPDGSQDYARIGSKIVYADAESGPEVFTTPNGEFPRLMIHEDSLGHPGRRVGTNRNDLDPWDTQDIRVKETTVASNGDGPGVDVRPFERRVAELEANLNRANKLLAERDKELERLRNQRAKTVNGSLDEDAVRKIAEDAALAVVSDLDEKVSDLTDRFDRIRGAITA
jgi:hypothetical protein